MKLGDWMQSNPTDRFQNHVARFCSDEIFYIFYIIYILYIYIIYIIYIYVCMFQELTQANYFPVVGLHNTRDCQSVLEIGVHASFFILHFCRSSWFVFHSLVIMAWSCLLIKSCLFVQCVHVSCRLIWVMGSMWSHQFIPIGSICLLYPTAIWWVLIR